MPLQLATTDDLRSTLCAVRGSRAATAANERHRKAELGRIDLAIAIGVPRLEDVERALATLPQELSQLVRERRLSIGVEFELSARAAHDREQPVAPARPFEDVLQLGQPVEGVVQPP